MQTMKNTIRQQVYGYHTTFLKDLVELFLVSKDTLEIVSLLKQSELIDEWEIAIFLPVERFQKASKATVWRDSRRFF